MKKISLLVCVVFLLAMAFLVVPVAGVATQIAVNAGNGQSATVATAVTTLPSVIVKDGSDAPVAGVDVTFAVATGGGSITGGTATTGADGIATVGSWTLGTTAGANTLTATSGSLTGSPVTFTATGTAGAATQIALNAGNSQSATVGTAVSTAPSVIVKDANNNPVSGVTVTFAAASGSGSVTGGSAMTGSNGIATVGSWTLGTTAGANTLTATSGSLTGSPVTFTATGTAVSAPTLSSITPPSGYNNSAVSVTNLAGTGFLSGATVVLSKSGQTNITATGVSIVSATQIACSFPITGKTAGSWNVIVTNSDGQSGTLANGFTIIDTGTTATLSSITPTSGIVNTSVTISSIAGSNFGSTASFLLRKTATNDIPVTVTSRTSTTNIAGTVDLNGRTPGAYQVCVVNSGADAVCGLTFTITTLTSNGNISIKSTPSGAKIYLNSTYKGITPLMVYDVVPGTYKVLLQKEGYQDWSQNIVVKSGEQTDVYPTIYAKSVTTTVATLIPTTVTTATTKKTTLKTPTPWPTSTPTPASPVGILAILGAVGVGLLVIRKR